MNYNLISFFKFLGVSRMMSNQSKYILFQLQVGLQANVPQPYDDDEDGADHNTTVDDIEAALTDLQVNSYLIIVLN